MGSLKWKVYLIYLGEILGDKPSIPGEIQTGGASWEEEDC